MPKLIRHNLVKTIAMFLLINIVSFSPAKATTIDINVGGYVFEPFVYEDKTGLTIQLIDALNTHQTLYKFIFTPIPPRRRYSLISEGKIDAIFFESPDWHWANYDAHIVQSTPLMTFKELYVTRRDHPFAAKAIKDVAKHKVAIMNGFHYRAFDFEVNSLTLKKQYQVTLTNKQQQAFYLMESGAVDAAILNDAYLNTLFIKNPDLENKILVSETIDCEYSLPVLLRKKAPISIEVLNKMIHDLEKSDQAPFLNPIGK